MKILIDNGHGQETPGKCSPDGKVKEYLIARDIAHRLFMRLKDKGLKAYLITPEVSDVPINTRVKRVNAQCKIEPCILISIHVNAYGNDSKWHEARGFTAHVSFNAGVSSRRLATLLTKEARRSNLAGNRDRGTDYIQQNLGMCRDTVCPAVLTENLFMDNRLDAAMLLDYNERERLVELHVNAIEKYLKF